LPTVNSVAALDSYGVLADFSNWGNGLTICAPGDSIYTTDRTGSAGYSSIDYAWMNGTSFSAPYAAGVAALLLSIEPSLTVDEIENTIKTTAIDLGSAGYDTTFGWGFINANNALASIDVALCEGDIDGNSMINVADLLAIIDQWGLIDSPADVTGDGIVDVSDLLLVVGNWGPCE
jgi:subtilisin family serine protease